MGTILMIALIMAVTELLITKIVEVMGCKASSYLVFAIVDIVVGLLIFVFALWDLRTSVGEFAGIFGQLALMIGEPIAAVFLIGDLIVWKVSKKAALSEG